MWLMPNVLDGQIVECFQWSSKFYWAAMKCQSTQTRNRGPHLIFLLNAPMSSCKNDWITYAETCAGWIMSHTFFFLSLALVLASTKPKRGPAPYLRLWFVLTLPENSLSRPLSQTSPSSCTETPLLSGVLPSEHDFIVNTSSPSFHRSRMAMPILLGNSSSVITILISPPFKFIYFSYRVRVFARSSSSYRTV